MALFIASDGTRIEIRPIRRDDAQRLRGAYARLSPESRYRRFLGVKPVLSSGDVRYLVDVDGANHFALVATITDGDDESIVAVARFVRLVEDPATAEFAIVVGDDYQRQGLATEMLRRLAAASQERGIDRWHATTLTDNVAIQRLIERLADGEIAAVRRGSVTEIDFPLPPAPGPRAAAPGRRRSVRPRGGSLQSSRRALEADRPLRT